MKIHDLSVYVCVNGVVKYRKLLSFLQSAHDFISSVAVSLATALFEIIL